MNGSLVFRSLAESLVITLMMVLSLSVVTAQVRSSPNYQIQSDSINLGGGLSTSSNYSLESTAGEIATGESNSTNFSLKAGYQQMQEVFISLTSPGDVIMDTAIPGLTGGVSNGSTTVTVVTDSPSGYQMTIEAESAPAMRKGSDFIADYVPQSNPNADLMFTTNSGVAHFGFSPLGEDAAPAFRNNTSVCGAGVLSTPLTCWDGLSTSSQEIAVGTGANHPAGATTTLQFRVGHGGGISVAPGSYVATTTLTALPL
jgi:hypothetical protein